jgi:hypothetical protein
MDWSSELRAIVAWWIGWGLLDAAWKYFLGATVVSFAGWGLACYQNSAWQRELRGAMIGLSAATLAIMASVLEGRPPVASPQLPTSPFQVAAPVSDVSKTNESATGCIQSVPPKWQERAGPQSGPMGPIMAVELVGTFNRLPKPCRLKVTGPDSEFLSTLRWLLSYGAAGAPVCEIEPTTAEPPNIDEPNPVRPTTKPGIVVHWDESYSPGEAIAHYLDSSSLQVSVSHRMPKASPSNLIWIDIGPGSPWK